ncbi:MAG: hypothetical protein JWN24_2859 [Phycisphaerales bacterium]|nr:hypothetical protein [Phycisphaerales bacterium]
MQCEMACARSGTLKKSPVGAVQPMRFTPPTISPLVNTSHLPVPIISPWTATSLGSHGWWRIISALARTPAYGHRVGWRGTGPSYFFFPTATFALAARSCFFF